ncbi:hypothetical protein [Bacillus sp. AFS031507]|uniref:hypothetical protein n=1 Tax=Bacillus sp. AFS031507 TaxID=2033496 RepID=UPI000BFD7289|nr:hypothetical protein [Bacillus sp. AFS031507]PGY11121.1 hypothetical protein COE25_11405 [Bacillus sp. AFS031507]
MKSLIGLMMVIALLGACNRTDNTKQQLNTSNVSTDQGKHIGTEYGGQGTGYGQVKRVPSGNAVTPIAPIDPFEKATKQMVSYIESKGITVSKTYHETYESSYYGEMVKATVIYAETDRHMTTQEIIDFQNYCLNNIVNWKYAHQYSYNGGKQIAITVF